VTLLTTVGITPTLHISSLSQMALKVSLRVSTTPHSSLFAVALCGAAQDPNTDIKSSYLFVGISLHSNVDLASGAITASKFQVKPHLDQDQNSKKYTFVCAYLYPSFSPTPTVVRGDQEAMRHISYSRALATVAWSFDHSSYGPNTTISSIWGKNFIQSWPFVLT